VRSRTIAVALTLAFGLAAGAAPTASHEPAAKSFKNCTKQNNRYAHGVGRPKAKDHTSGTPVRNFKKSRPLYKANKHLDRDKDGIACEKH
jgi:hypothetical protein